MVEVIGVLIPFGAFAMIVAIVWVVMASLTARRKATLRTIEDAIKTGQTLTPETIRALGMPRGSNSNGDIKSGSILIALAAACLATGYITGFVGTFAAIAAFPGFVGLALLGFGLTSKKPDAE